MEALTSVLSAESYQSLRTELDRLKENAPPASGSGLDHLAYVPNNLEERMGQGSHISPLDTTFFLAVNFLSFERQVRKRLTTLLTAESLIPPYLCPITLNVNPQ